LNLLLLATIDISRHNIFELCDIVKSFNPVIVPRFEGMYKAAIYIKSDEVEKAIKTIEQAIDLEDFIDLHFPHLHFH
jgi:hypothetical protein